MSWRICGFGTSGENGAYETEIQESKNQVSGALRHSRERGLYQTGLLLFFFFFHFLYTYRHQNDTFSFNGIANYKMNHALLLK